MSASAQPHEVEDGQCDRCGCDDSWSSSPCPGPVEDQPRRCVVDGCENDVSCFGSYEGAPEGFACDEHCGHGCEDGDCWPIEDLSTMRRS